jgi:hypothetical protein
MKLIVVHIRDGYNRRKVQLTPQHAEFGRACKDSKLIGIAFREQMQYDKECRKRGRLVNMLMQVMQTDLTSKWGARNVQDGDIALLEYFNFNRLRSLHNLLPLGVESDINGVTGICKIELPDMLPEQDLRYAGNPTHVQFTLGAASIDFKTGWCSKSKTKSAYLSMGKKVKLRLHSMVDIEEGVPILLALGINFFSKINNKYYQVRTGGGQCLTIVKVARGIVEE